MLAVLRAMIQRQEPPCEALEVGTANWFGPSSTVLAGLSANAEHGPVIFERRNSTTLGPGLFRVHEKTPMALRAPSFSAKPALAPTPKGLTPALCRAVLCDDEATLTKAWNSLSLDAQTAVVTTAAAVGSNKLLRMALKEELKEGAQGVDKKKSKRGTEGSLACRSDGGLAGNMPLHYAALCGQVESAAILLDAGAKASAENPVKTQPLHDAARIGNLPLIRALLAHGADALAVNKYGDNMLHRCALYADQDAERYDAVMRYAVSFVRGKKGDAAALAFVNQLNSVGKDGRPDFTPLDAAVACDQPVLAQCLRELGAQHGPNFLAVGKAWTRAHVDHEGQWAKVEVPLILAEQAKGDPVAA